jgi:hypothetical protein
MSKTHENDDGFLILFFENDNTYSVVSTKSEGCRNITATTAEMLYKNSWFTGFIKYRGNS